MSLSVAKLGELMQDTHDPYRLILISTLGTFNLLDLLILDIHSSRDIHIGHF